MTDDMKNGLEHLAATGTAYKDPVEAIAWDQADSARSWLPTSLLPNLRSRDTENLPRDFILRFSRLEFARVAAVGLWLETLLINRVTSGGLDAAKARETRGLLQEIREESGHGLMFLRAIEAAGAEGVRVLGPTRLLDWFGHRLDSHKPGFWAMVYIAESVTDKFAQMALAQSEDLCPVARQVLDLHHRDEMRHLGLARTLLEDRLSKMSFTRHQMLRIGLKLFLGRFLLAVLYPTPESLAALGLSDPVGAARAIRSCPERRALARHCIAPALEVLAGIAPRTKIRKEEFRI